MSFQVALIDFPRLQEQIAVRLLSEHNVETQRIARQEAADRLSLFNLALFFWPDTGTDNHHRLSEVNSRGGGSSTPIVIVTSEAGRRTAEPLVGAQGVVDVLVTPLMPHVVSRKLTALLGLQREPSPAKLDVAHINPFVNATVETLKQMANVECQRVNLAVRTDAAVEGFISGTMGLSGAAEGFVAITFEDQLARKIVCQMLQISLGEETDDDIRDGVGELMNVIAGAAKAELANTEHSFQLSLPTVIVGGPHTVGQPRGVPVIAIEFSIEDSRFQVMVCLNPKRKT